MFMSKKSRAKIDLNFLRPSPYTDKKWKSPLHTWILFGEKSSKLIAQGGGGGGGVVDLTNIQKRSWVLLDDRKKNNTLPLTENPPKILSEKQNPKNTHVRYYSLRRSSHDIMIMKIFAY